MPTKPLRLPSAGTSPTEGEARVKAYIHRGAAKAAWRVYCISDQWPVTSDQLYNWYAEIRKSETYIHGGAANPGHVRLTRRFI